MIEKFYRIVPSRQIGVLREAILMKNHSRVNIFSELMHNDWMLQAMWEVLTNQSALFKNWYERRKFAMVPQNRTVINKFHIIDARSWNTSCVPLIPDFSDTFSYVWDYHGSWPWTSSATLRCLPGYEIPARFGSVRQFWPDLAIFKSFSCIKLSHKSSPQYFGAF